MANLTKVRTRKADDSVEVVVLVTHPMETGLRKDKDTGKVFDAHYIQQLTVDHKGKQVALAHMGTAVSENPLLTFRFKPAMVKNGDMIKVSWKDNKGGGETLEVVVKDL